MIDLVEKIKIAMVKLKVSQTELAIRSTQSKANLTNKFNRNDFKLSEYQRLVDALDCKLEINIVLPNGDKV